MFMKTKTSDCIQMSHRGAEKVSERINGVTLEQELAFWRERSHILRQRQEIAKGERHVPTNEEQQAP